MKKQTWEDKFDDIKLTYWSEDAGCNYDEPLGLAMEQEVAVKLFIKKTISDHDRELVEKIKKMKLYYPKIKWDSFASPKIEIISIIRQSSDFFRQQIIHALAQEFIKKGI